MSQGGRVENKKHSTSCLFLQHFVESEREFLNSLFLTNRSTFVLHEIPLSESLLVASSILYSLSLSRARILFERACTSPPLQLSPRQSFNEVALSIFTGESGIYSILFNLFVCIFPLS